VAIVGGIEGVCSSGTVGVCVEAVRVWIGELFVGLVFKNLVMSSGVLAGVTLSMNTHDGSINTMELSSEWLGTGMSDAESMSRCIN
jgi:hypothetical protein